MASDQPWLVRMETLGEMRQAIEPGILKLAGGTGYP